MTSKISALADAGTQILAQLEFHRWFVTGQQQAQANQACGVEKTEKGDLGRIIKLIDVIDHQQAARGCMKVVGSRAISQQQGGAAAQRQSGGGVEQVALAAARGTPKINRVEAARLRKHAQARQQFVVFADDEIVERGRLVEPKIEQ